MFLFDIDGSARYSAVKQAIIADIHAFGPTAAVDGNWYDFLARIDPAHIRRCRFATTLDMGLDWDVRLTIAYRLLLGRTPEADRFADEPQNFPDLLCGILMSAEFEQIRSCLRFLRGAAFNRTRKLIFLHVPRTGGTYLSATLERIAPLGFADCYDLNEPTWMLNASFGSVFAAHFSRSLYREDAGHLFVAVVRSPRDRFLSRARYYGLSSSTYSSVPSFLMDEALDGFQTRFVFGDDVSEVIFSDRATLLIPFERVGSLVDGLQEMGLCESRPAEVFKNRSKDIDLLTIPAAVLGAVDNDSDHRLCTQANEMFSLPSVVNRLTDWFNT